MSVIAYIGMGSNLGDRAATIRAAIEALDAAEGVVVLRASSLHETAPVGGPSGQGPYLNAALKVETTLPPRDLLGVLQAIERDSGRVRAERWGERTLDLDLLLYGQEVIDEPGLIVPHPRLAVRRFVLAPLDEICKGFLDVLNIRSVGGLLSDLDRRPGGVVLCGPDPGGAVAAGVLAGLDGIDLTGEIQIGSEFRSRISDGDRWRVFSKSSHGAAVRLRGFDQVWPNFLVTWGPVAEAPGTDLRARLRRLSEGYVGRYLLRIRPPEGGGTAEDRLVSEILATCAASRVPTRVVGST